MAEEAKDCIDPFVMLALVGCACLVHVLVAQLTPHALVQIERERGNLEEAIRYKCIVLQNMDDASEFDWEEYATTAFVSCCAIHVGYSLAELYAAVGNEQQAYKCLCKAHRMDKEDTVGLCCLHLAPASHHICRGFCFGLVVLLLQWRTTIKPSSLSAPT